MNDEIKECGNCVYCQVDRSLVQDRCKECMSGAICTYKNFEILEPPYYLEELITKTIRVMLYPNNPDFKKDLQEYKKGLRP